MVREDSTGGWVPLGAGGLSHVAVRKRKIHHEDDPPCKHEYLIYGKRINDQKVKIFNSNTIIIIIIIIIIMFPLLFMQVVKPSSTYFFACVGFLSLKQGCIEKGSKIIIL